MAALINSRIMRIVPLLVAVCLVGMAASAETSTYVFVPDQSKVVQTGGIAGIHWTYSVRGEFQLTVDPNAGSVSFAHVDANATDDSPFKRTLDLNHVFDMTSLVGTVEPSGSIKFTGKASDDSDILITVTLQDGLAHLIGQTTPPPNSADFFIFSLNAVAQVLKYGGGSGTADDPYQIATADGLVALGETPEDYDKHFILTADIDLDPNLLGRKIFDEAVIFFFTGVFDGNGHTISHLTIIGPRYPVGLFGILNPYGYDVLDRGTEVKNLGIVDVNITGSGDCVGGLVGDNHYGSVTHCYSTGAVISTGGSTGGLVGSNGGHVKRCYSTAAVSGSGNFGGVGGLVGGNVRDGDVTECYSTGPVTGNSCVGGLVGYNSGAITRCYSTGAVSGTGDNVGGLVGINAYGTVTECYSTGTVNGNYCVGGLVGSNGECLGRECYPGWISKCHATGSVSGTGGVGGLVGSILGPSVVTGSFWDIQTSGQTTSDGGTGKTTAEMQTAGTFLEAGWDFVNVWGIGENQTYPYLRKYSAADINQDASVNFLDLALLAENWLTGVAP